MARIAIDYTPAFEQGGGIGRYVRELTTALTRIDTETPYRLFVAGAHSGQVPPAPSSISVWKPTRITPKWLARIWHRARIPLPVELFTGRVDLFHATDFVLPPTLPGTQTIVTVHDLSFARVPEAASPRLKDYLDRVVPRSVHRADLVLADSQSTKDDLVELFGLSPAKITVLLSGVDDRFHHIDVPSLTIRRAYQLGERPYIFSVGTIQPRKNYVRLIEALAILRTRGLDLSLVIAGGRGWLEDPIYQAIQQHQMQDYVHLIGFTDDNDLPALYSHAALVAFPSLYEGFGLPVLEAMACGTPVVTSNISSLPEVAGDAALMVNPYDVEAIVEAMRRLVEDQTLRDDLIQRGYARAKQFTWEASARQLKQIYDRVLA